MDLLQIQAIAQSNPFLGRQLLTKYQQDRAAAGGALYRITEQPQPQAPLMPAPPAAGPGPQAAPAPPPGTLSPGGGNPAVMPAAAPRPGMMPPPPAAAPGPAAVPPQAAAPEPAPLPPYRALPMAAPGGDTGGVPPPPVPAPGMDPSQPRPLDLKSIITGLKASGVKPDQVIDVLDTLAPTMNAQNKQELDLYRATTAAQQAAIRAFQAERESLPNASLSVSWFRSRGLIFHFSSDG